MSTLKQDFAKKTAEAESLRASVEKAEATLASAVNLLDKLGGEKTRWATQVRKMCDVCDGCFNWIWIGHSSYSSSLPGISQWAAVLCIACDAWAPRASVEKADSSTRQVKALDVELGESPLSALFTAAFITYLAGHPEDVRARVQKEWLAALGVKVGGGWKGC